MFLSPNRKQGHRVKKEKNISETVHWRASDSLPFVLGHRNVTALNLIYFLLDKLVIKRTGSHDQKQSMQRPPEHMHVAGGKARIPDQSTAGGHCGRT